MSVITNECEQQAADINGGALNERMKKNRTHEHYLQGG
jgi:hypothetical protein